jgi:hypothetical protein
MKHHEHLLTALNFKMRFVPLITAGLEIRALGRDPYPGEACKLQTIRAIGNRKYKVGDLLQMYAEDDAVSSNKIGQTVCREVTPVTIETAFMCVVVERNGMRVPLFADEIEQLAIADGFQNSIEFFCFLDATYGGCFRGQLIKW